jgi:hypothetical protein
MINFLYNFCSQYGVSFSPTDNQQFTHTSCMHPLLLSDFNRNRNVSTKSDRTTQYYIFENSTNGSAAVIYEDKHNEANRRIFPRFTLNKPKRITLF